MNKKKSALLAALVEQKKEYMDHLIDLMTEPIAAVFMKVYQDALDKHNDVRTKGILVVFQEHLAQIIDWNATRVSSEYEGLVHATGCSYLPDLVHAMIVTNVKVNVLVNDQDLESVKLKLPSTENFVHKWLIYTARGMWKKPYLLYHKARSLERQQYMNEVEEIIQKALTTTVRSFMPMLDMVQKQHSHAKEAEPESSSDEDDPSESEEESESDEDDPSESEEESESDEEEPESSDAESEGSEELASESEEDSESDEEEAEVNDEPLSDDNDPVQAESDGYDPLSSDGGSSEADEEPEYVDVSKQDAVDLLNIPQVLDQLPEIPHIVEEESIENFTDDIPRIVDVNANENEQESFTNVAYEEEEPIEMKQVEWDEGKKDESADIDVSEPVHKIEANAEAVVEQESVEKAAEVVTHVPYGSMLINKRVLHTPKLKLKTKTVDAFF